MSNSTDQIVKTLADSFFTWFNNDIFPVCVVIFDILVIIVGVILNILLVVTFRKRGLFNEPSTFFIFAMCILDFIAYPFLLVPHVIAAIAGQWLLSQPVCEIHGAMKDVLMIGQFYILIILSIERTLKLVVNAEKYYDKIFEKTKVVRIILGVTCGMAAIVGFIPVTGAGDIRYEFYHHGCALNYVKGKVFLYVHFALIVVVSSVSVVICYILIFNERHKAIIKDRLQCFKKSQLSERKKSDMSNGNDATLPTITEADDDAFEGETSDKDKIVKTPDHNTRRNTNARPGSRPKSSKRQSVIFEVFSDDEENPAFHLSITYLSLYGAILTCYLPYFVATFYDAFSSDSLWGGFYTITLLIMHTSFVAKPIIYLGHNRQYREVTKQTVPQSIRNRARSVRGSVSSVQSKIEDFVFKSAANKRFGATLAAHKAVLVWKKRTKKNTATLNLKPSSSKDTTDSANVIPKSILINKDENNAVLDQQTTNKPPNSVIKAFDQTNSGRLSAAVTPSSIEVAPTSSFIERERERLAGLHGLTRGPSSPTHTVQMTNMNVLNNEENNSMPGVVSDNDGHSPNQGQTLLALGRT